MEAVYQLKSNELNDEFFKTIKNLFGDKEVKITIEASHDETAYLMQDEEYWKTLIERYAAVKNGDVKHILTMEEVEALAK